MASYSLAVGSSRPSPRARRSKAGAFWRRTGERGACPIRRALHSWGCGVGDFQLADVAVPREVFAAMLCRIHGLADHVQLVQQPALAGDGSDAWCELEVHLHTPGAKTRCALTLRNDLSSQVGSRLVRRASGGAARARGTIVRAAFGQKSR